MQFLKQRDRRTEQHKEKEKIEGQEKNRETRKDRKRRKERKRQKERKKEKRASTGAINHIKETYQIICLIPKIYWCGSTLNLR